VAVADGRPSLVAVENRLLGFQDYYESIAKPFEWKFTREDLQDLLARIETQPAVLDPAA